jgi:hypothetical protein
MNLGDYLEASPQWATFDAYVIAYDEFLMMLGDETGTIFAYPLNGMYFAVGDIVRVSGIRTFMGGKNFVSAGYDIQYMGWDWYQPSGLDPLTLDDLDAMPYDDPMSYGDPYTFEGTIVPTTNRWGGLSPALTNGTVTALLAGDLVWDAMMFEGYRVRLDAYVFDHSDGQWTLWLTDITLGDYTDQEKIDAFRAELTEAYDGMVHYGGTPLVFQTYHDVFSDIDAYYQGIGDFADAYDNGSELFMAYMEEVHVRIQISIVTPTLTETFEVVIDLLPPVADTSLSYFLDEGIDGTSYTMVLTVVHNTFKEVLLTDGERIVCMATWDYSVGRGDTVIVTGTRETVDGRIQLGYDSKILAVIDSGVHEIPDAIFVPFGDVVGITDPSLHYDYITVKGRLVFNSGKNMYELVNGDLRITISYQGNAGAQLSDASGSIVTLDAIIYPDEAWFMMFFLGTATDLTIVG